MTKYSLTSKVMLPILGIVLFVIFTVAVTIKYGGKLLLDSYTEVNAHELAEAFLIAVESDSSTANIIRATNSIGTFEDIDAIFILDSETQKIIASNKNRFRNKNINDIPEMAENNEVMDVINSAGSAFFVLPDSEYHLIFSTKLLSPEKGHTTPITIVMCVHPESIMAFFTDIINNTLIALSLVFIFMMGMIFYLLRKNVLQPISYLASMMVTGACLLNKKVQYDSSLEIQQLSDSYHDLLNKNVIQNEELIKANKQLKSLSETDGLTQIPNRRQFEFSLNSEWNRALRENQSLSLLMLDIDHFKNLNDTYGHQVGDQCLKAVAKVLQQTLKRAGDRVFRYGGEEFAILAPNSNEQISELAEKIRHEVESLSIPLGGGREISVTMSIGLATIKANALPDVQTLVELADKALYRAKAEGRNRTVACRGIEMSLMDIPPKHLSSSGNHQNNRPQM